MARSSSANPVEWRVPDAFRVGDEVEWRGITLVCTRSHYAGDAAEHPWDPGDGWDVLRASGLWTPSGRVNAARLGTRAEYETDERLRWVMMEASGG